MPDEPEGQSLTTVGGWLKYLQEQGVAIVVLVLMIGVLIYFIWKIEPERQAAQNTAVEKALIAAEAVHAKAFEVQEKRHSDDRLKFLEYRTKADERQASQQVASDQRNEREIARIVDLLTVMKKQGESTAKDVKDVKALSMP